MQTDKEREKRARELAEKLGISYEGLIAHMTTEALKYIYSQMPPQKEEAQ